MPSQDLTLANLDAGDSGTATETTSDVPISTNDSDLGIAAPDDVPIVEDEELELPPKETDLIDVTAMTDEEFLFYLTNQADDMDWSRAITDGKDLIANFEEDYGYVMPDDVLNELIEEALANFELTNEELEAWGIDSQSLSEDVLAALLSSQAQGLLPDEVELLLDSYNAYQNIVRVDDFIDEYYQPGDTGGELIYRYMQRTILNDLANQIDAEGKTIDNKFLKIFEKPLQWMSSFNSVSGLSLSESITGRPDFALELLKTLDDSASYDVTYSTKVYFALSAIAQILKTSDITVDELKENLNINMTSMDGSDDNMISSMLFTLGALAFKNVDTTETDLSTLSDIFTSLMMGRMNNLTFMHEDWVRPAYLAYFTIGLLAGAFGADGITINDLSDAVADTKLGMLSIPFGNGTTTLVIQPGTVGPDLFLINRADLTNARTITNWASKIGIISPVVSTLIKTVLVGGTLLPYYLDKTTYDELTQAVIQPIVNSMAEQRIAQLRGDSVESGVYASEDYITIRDSIDHNTDMSEDGFKYNPSDLSPFPILPYLPARPSTAPITGILPDKKLDESDDVIEELQTDPDELAQTKNPVLDRYLQTDFEDKTGASLDVYDEEEKKRESSPSKILPLGHADLADL